MTNILEAIVNMANFPIYTLKNQYRGRNRVNNIGEALEIFIKDAFSNSLGLINENEVIKNYNQYFSWLGNQNHPPDIMIKGGDAIEVKKTQSAKSDLALNSSYPKSSIRSDSKMITQACKTCEEWKEKDLIYCVGHIPKDKYQNFPQESIDKIEKNTDLISKDIQVKNPNNPAKLIDCKIITFKI